MSPDQLVPIAFTVIFVGLFMYLTFASWFSNRRKEREAFYKSEIFRRITGVAGEGAKLTIELLREEDRLKQIRGRDGKKIAGIINIGVGLALATCLLTVYHNVDSIAFIGLIPVFVGAGLLVYVYFLAAPLEDGPKA